MHAASPLAGTLADGLMWYDARDLVVEGQGWSDVESSFDRLPLRARDVLTEPEVWDLSHDSAGLCVRFETDSPRIGADWQLRRERLSLHHMPATGASGADLYVREERGWRFAGMGMCFRDGRGWMDCRDVPPNMRECAMYFPLFNGVTSFRIAIEPGRTIHRPPRRRGLSKPIVFYGTSIVHGASASRPGMAYPAMIGRWLDCPIINLGFSGKGKMYPELVKFFTELDASVFVADCLPNMKPQEVEQRTAPMVLQLRKAHPKMPIVLVDNIVDQRLLSDMDDSGRQMKNRMLQAAYERCIAEGVSNLHLVSADPILGHDWDSTVDGVHPNDLGFHRMATALHAVLKPIVARVQETTT